MMTTLQANDRSPAHFVRLDKPRAVDDLYIGKREKMRRWLCCACHVEEPYHSSENEHLRSPKHHNDYGIALFFKLVVVISWP